YSGLGLLKVNENYLTARLPALVLVLFGLERLLHGHHWVSLLLLVVAVAVHPLMGLVGIFFYLAWWLMTTLKPALLAAVVGVSAVATLMVLFYPPLGNRLFGIMDDEWRAFVVPINNFAFSTEWLVGDWLRIFIACGAIVGGCRYLENAPNVVR